MFEKCRRSLYTFHFLISSIFIVQTFNIFILFYINKCLFEIDEIIRCVIE